VLSSDSECGHYDIFCIIFKALYVITAAQIRSARAILRWSAAHLARQSGVSLPTIQRLEAFEGVPNGRSSTLVQLQRTLEAAGIEFIGTPDDGPGIRHRPPKA
jgi:transcriptional regulator with XRE-family HTH domain